MTERERYITNFLLKWEGGFGTDGMDGGCTMKGITLTTYRAFFGKSKNCNDLYHISDEEWFYIFRKGVYDRVKGDKIVNDSICLLVVDFAYNSGKGTAIREVQKCLGCTPDGIIGPITLGKLNEENSYEVFCKIKSWREGFYRNLATKKPKKYRKYLKGWLNRLNDIKYKGFDE